MGSDTKNHPTVARQLGFCWASLAEGLGEVGLVDGAFILLAAGCLGGVSRARSQVVGVIDTPDDIQFNPW